MLDGRRKEAEKSQYEIQKLISEIAHQLRTPLSNIKKLYRIAARVIK